MDRATLIGIVTAVARRWWLAVVVVIVVVSIDGAITAQSPRTYLARTTLLIGPSHSVDHSQLVYSVDALGRSMVVQTYANVLSTDVVRREALTRVGVAPDQTDADINIKTAALAESALVQVSVVAADPYLAAAVANAIGQVGEVRMSEFYPIYDLTSVTPATPVTHAYRPDVPRNLSLGLLCGLLLGVLCAWVADALLVRAREPGS